MLSLPHPGRTRLHHTPSVAEFGVPPLAQAGTGEIEREAVVALADFARRARDKVVGFDGGLDDVGQGSRPQRDKAASIGVRLTSRESNCCHRLRHRILSSLDTAR